MQTQFQNIMAVTPARAVPTSPLQLLGQATLHEVVPASWQEAGAALGFIMAAIGQQAGPCLWLRSPQTEKDLGQAFGPGLHHFGVNPNQIMIATARHDKDVLGIMEEGLSEPALTNVIAALPANSVHYDLTASRRLALRAKEHGVRAVLIRTGPRLAPSAAHYRWQISARPHQARNTHQTHNAHKTHRAAHQPAPSFTPAWQVGLVKSKQCAPGRWAMSWNHETHSICVDALSADGSADQAAEQRG